jgi:hypothetical protein
MYYEKIERATLPQVKSGVKFCPRMRAVMRDKKNKKAQKGAWCDKVAPHLTVEALVLELMEHG